MADCLSKVCILLHGTALLLRTSCPVKGYISQPPYLEMGPHDWLWTVECEQKCHGSLSGHGSRSWAWSSWSCFSCLHWIPKLRATLEATWWSWYSLGQPWSLNDFVEHPCWTATRVRDKFSEGLSNLGFGCVGYWSWTVVLKLWYIRITGRLIQTQIVGLISRISDSVALDWSPRMCISHKLAEMLMLLTHHPRTIITWDNAIEHKEVMWGMFSKMVWEVRKLKQTLT